MCSIVETENLDSLTLKSLPSSILLKKLTNLGIALSESEALDKLKYIANLNIVNKSYIGMGYHNTLVPNVILRNIMESPSWYTQYTPYQPEIAQGRLESLVNYQTMITDLTGMDISNASLLDEGTAAAEAMVLCFASDKKRNTFLVDLNCHPQTIECIKTRAQGFKINVVVGDFNTLDLSAFGNDIMGALFQYPNTSGEIIDYSKFVETIHGYGGLVACATDLMALAMLKPPGEFGVDIALGNCQRFGVPLGFI